MEHPDSDSQTHSGTFATTHWSVVLAAGERGLPEAREALENLCRTYWYPLYAYIRRRGSGHEDAQDLTQGFLLQLLEHDAFKRSLHGLLDGLPVRGFHRGYRKSGRDELFGGLAALPAC